MDITSLIKYKKENKIPKKAKPIKEIKLSEDQKKSWRLKLEGMKREQVNGCWESEKKAERVYLVINGSRYLLHRISYYVFRGDIQDGLFICHKCDNPKCFNPEHLFTGTAKDNNDDKMKKNRHVKRGPIPDEPRDPNKPIVDVPCVLKTKKQHILSIRTDKHLVDQARMLGINVSKSLHDCLKDLVYQEFKRRGISK